MNVLLDFRSLRQKVNVKSIRLGVNPSEIVHSMTLRRWPSTVTTPSILPALPAWNRAVLILGAPDAPKEDWTVAPVPVLFPALLDSLMPSPRLDERFDDLIARAFLVRRGPCSETGP